MKHTANACAVVVTFNRRELLLECLQGLVSQSMPLASIIIVDNASTDDTSASLFEAGFINTLPPKEIDEPFEIEFETDFLDVKGNNIHIKYTYMHENTGGSGGFQYGIKRAYEAGFDYIWIMDDDVKARSNALENALKKLIGNSDIIIQNSREYSDGTLYEFGSKNNYFNYIHKIKYNWEELKYLEEYEVPFCSFEGLIIPRNAIGRVGLPNAKFFISFDDTDYGYRLIKSGYTIRVLGSSRLTKLVREKNDRLVSGSGRNEYARFWREYYKLRNLIFFLRRNFSLIFACRYGTYFLIRKIYGIVAYDDNKMARMRILLRAYFDGFLQATE